MKKSDFKLGLTTHKVFSIDEILLEIQDQYGSGGLALLAIRAMQAMDCEDTFKMTQKKIRELQ